MSDIRAAEAARKEMRTTGETPIPWAQVKVDLGLARPTKSPWLLQRHGNCASSTRKVAAVSRRQ